MCPTRDQPAAGWPAEPTQPCDQRCPSAVGHKSIHAALKRLEGLQVLQPCSHLTPFPVWGLQAAAKAAGCSGTSSAISVLQCCMMGLEVSWRLPTGDQLGSTRSISPADWWEQSAHEVATQATPRAGQQLLPSQMLT